MHLLCIHALTEGHYTLEKLSLLSNTLQDTGKVTVFKKQKYFMYILFIYDE
jgi:hypothetical protein